MSSSRRPVLGRGLSALIPSAAEEAPPAAGGVRMMPLAQIEPARQQPRTAFDEERIATLAASIEADGLLQPIVVRSLGGERYEIVAGERRYRASKRVGLEAVPVVVREASDAEAYELALIENVQREDLGPLEEAEAFRYLADEHGHTQEQIAQRVGRDRATVSNALRLLKLPEEVRAWVASGALSGGHGRAILTAPSEVQVELAQLAVTEGWSVRETERRARAAKAEPEAAPAKAGSKAAPLPRSAAAEAVEAQLRAVLGAPIKLVNRKGKGRIEVRFHSLDELERLIDLLSGLEGR